MCIQWALALARKARDENIIQNDFALEDIYKVLKLFLLIASECLLHSFFAHFCFLCTKKFILQACIDFRQNHIYLYLYSWIPVPLGYTQVLLLRIISLKHPLLCVNCHQLAMLKYGIVATEKQQMKKNNYTKLLVNYSCNSSTESHTLHKIRILHLSR